MERDIHRAESNGRERRRFWGLMSGVVAGAAAMFLLDPQNGKRRRALARDKAIKLRNTIDQAITEDLPKRLDYFSGFAVGAKHQVSEAIEGSDARPANEQMLVDRVMSSVFRDPNVPKGDLNIDATGTTVYLRGTVDGQDTAQDIEKRVRDVEGVDDVINLINQPEADPSDLRQ